MNAEASSQTAANEYREAQRAFMGLYQEYLINQSVRLQPDTAQLATQKMMVGAAQMVAGKNLEDLNDFARDYITGKDL
eukprot:CAMPEP_0170463006 /NCGR_PEP_ID=MMETSP0123-20130129/8282_1 /TAXON_ID=182087 /ORGANISM="Favella ehrenbergii, Strain Fehren 1" /LENGTH=77 /DNA_ID=CAMNT_0010728335 /DNA_START=92 /DNA_END=325 /DNA_ORIENTATION=-